MAWIRRYRPGSSPRKHVGFVYHTDRLRGLPGCRQGQGNLKDAQEELDKALQRGQGRPGRRLLPQHLDIAAGRRHRPDAGSGSPRKPGAPRIAPLPSTFRSTAPNKTCSARSAAKMPEEARDALHWEMEGASRCCNGALEEISKAVRRGSIRRS